MNNKVQNLKKFVPMTRQEMTARGWNELDILFISGDAYIDHHSFGVPLLARFLMYKGYRVGIIAQPRTVEDIKILGTPKLFVGIGTGVVDSMLNNYTADKKPRRNDEYSPGGKGGLRPDNAGIAYSKMARLAFPGALIIGGGVEIALRRLSHYDYWQNKVLPSILFTGEYDFIVYGMGEKTTLEICEALKKNKRDEIKNIRGIAYVADKEDARLIENRITIPSHEEVKDDKKKFLKAVNLYSEEISPYNAKTIVQYYRNKAIVVTPPPFPITEAEMDEIYDLDFTKEQHWSYRENIPALDMIRFSIVSNRGCFGGCSFCSITLHQGKIVQSRSQNSIIKEIKKLLSMPEFKGIVTDIGGPTANMYMLCCTDREAQKTCKRTSCLFPSICNKLKTSHKEQIELLKTILKIQGIRKVFIASGVRYDLAMCDREYLKQLISEHVSGQLKVAPEHKDPKVLELMRKPSFEVFLKFREVFNNISISAGKEQYLVPYFISSFPGSTDAKMLDLENWLKKEHWKLQQIQNFIPLPMTLASAMYWTGLDYKTKEAIHVPKTQEERKKQKLNLQSYRKK